MLDLIPHTAGMPHRLLVKLTAGDDAPEKCAQAFTVCSVAAASGVAVSLWLTGEASWFALPGRAEAFELPHSAPLHELRDAVLAAGTLTPGVRLAGAALFVAEAMEEGTQALVY